MRMKVRKMFSFKDSNNNNNNNNNTRFQFHNRRLRAHLGTVQHTYNV